MSALEAIREQLVDCTDLVNVIGICCECLNHSPEFLLTVISDLSGIVCLEEDDDIPPAAVESGQTERVELCTAVRTQVSKRTAGGLQGAGVRTV